MGDGTRQPINLILHGTSIRQWWKVHPGVVVEHDKEMVPQDEVYAGIVVDGMNHEPLGVLSATFHESQLLWTTVNMEGFALVSTL